MTFINAGIISLMYLLGLVIVFNSWFNRVSQRLVAMAEAAHKNHEYDKDIQVWHYLPSPFAL